MANSEIRKVGIIGEGKMGTNLFYYLLDFGFEMVWVCSQAADTGKIRKTFERKMRRHADAGLVDEDAYLRIIEKTVITDSVASLDDCGLVIEAINENSGLKQVLLQSLADVVPGSCILATNSSSIIPSGLSGNPGIRKRMIGLHFFYPVALKNIVEFIYTDETTEEVISAAVDFLRRIRREHILLHEKDGFLLNRIFLDLQNEAFHVTLEEKLSFQQVDAIIRKHLFPVGAFELCDSVGIDMMRISVENYASLSTGGQHYQQFLLFLEELIRKDRPGGRSGSGFMDRPPGPDDDETLLKTVSQQLTEKVKCRLTDALRSSISRFARQSGIATSELNHAMNEYLGTNLNE